jgi:hypothetical protein
MGTCPSWGSCGSDGGHVLAGVVVGPDKGHDPAGVLVGPDGDMSQLG